MATKYAGTVAAIYPDNGPLALVWTVCFYALLSGYLLLALSFRLHS
jgi:hypothetical protein